MKDKRMPGYQVKFETVSVGGVDYRIRSLLDRQQYYDPRGVAAAAGISPSSWPLFGLLWPSARILAQAMVSQDLKGKRVLEIGSGLALASLVVHRRKGNVTATDCHPLSAAFLTENLLLNHLGPLAHAAGNWGRENPDLGLFDLIIGSDVLYERDQPALLANFIARHSAPLVQVVIVDPDRGNRARFCKEMALLHYALVEARADCILDNGDVFKGRILRFDRGPTLYGTA